MISPSCLTRTALALNPVGMPSETRELCAMCGAIIRKGMLIQAFAPQAGFMDAAYLAAKSPVVCGDCAALWRKNIMQALFACIVTKKAAYPISQDVHRAHFLLNPPDPPFLVVVPTSKLQHLVWKTPVSQSKEYWMVRHGDRMLTIDRKKLMKAVDTCRKIMEQVETAKKPEKRSAHPFRRLDRNLKSPDHAVLRSDVLKAAAGDRRLIEMLKEVSRLSLGETWALATLAKRTGQSTVKPEPINI